MKQKEVIFNTRGITTELRHGNIFCCVCVCVFKWDKTFMKQNDFQHQKNLCRIIPGQCVCVSECVCVYVCAHFCVVVVVCVCACTCHVVGRGGSMGRGNGRCVYVHVPVCACVCAHACGQYSWVCTVITQLTCQPPSAASWVVWTNCCRLPNFCCSIFSLCKASWKTPQIQNMGQASNVQNTYNRPTRTSDWASRLVRGTTKDKNNCMCCFKMIYKLHQNLPLVEFMYLAFTRMPGELP